MENKIKITSKQNEVFEYFKKEKSSVLSYLNIFLWAHLYDSEKAFLFVEKEYLNYIGSKKGFTKVLDNIYRKELNNNQLHNSNDPYKKEILNFKNDGETQFETEIFNLSTKKTISFNMQGRIVKRDERGVPTLALGSYKDVTKDVEKDNLINKLTKIAYYDNLTNLPNRKMLIKNYKQNKIVGKFFAFIDLNDFKQINDTYGHSFGDASLAKFAKIIKQGLNDQLVKNLQIYRMYGDEFCITFSKANENISLEELIKKLSWVINQNVTIDNISINLSASIGVLRINRKNRFLTLKNVLTMADQAMYVAKTEKKPYHIYEFEDN